MTPADKLAVHEDSRPPRKAETFQPEKNRGLAQRQPLGYFLDR